MTTKPENIELLFRPAHIQKVKQQAAVLKRMTGISTSASQEITARAFDATSWQALLSSPVFRADEDLVEPDYAGGWPSAATQQRSRHLQTLLSSRLQISFRQADFIAKVWQPTALQAAYRGHPHAVYELADESRELISVLGAAPGCPPGVLVILTEGDRAGPPKLQLVKENRLARYLDQSDLFNLAEGARLDGRLESALSAFADEQTPKSTAAVRRAALVKNAFSLAPAAAAWLAESKPPALLAASWLKAPPAADALAKDFALHWPWRGEDFPGVPRRESHSFWAWEAPHFTLLGCVAGGTVWFRAVEPGRPGDSIAEAQAGVCIFREVTSDDGPVYDKGPGYWFMKYSNQQRGRPLPGMTPGLADELRRLTGFSSHSDGSATPFFASEAGLALAKWLASKPISARRYGGRMLNFYTGDTRASLALRMEYELARADLLA